MIENLNFLVCSKRLEIERGVSDNAFLTFKLYSVNSFSNMRYLSKTSCKNDIESISIFLSACIRSEDAFATLSSNFAMGFATFALNA